MSSEIKNNLMTQLKDVFDSTQKIESALQAEKKKNQKIAREYIQVRSQLEETVKKLNAELQEKVSHLDRLQKAYVQTRALEKTLNEKNKEALGSLRMTQGKLSEQELINEQLRHDLKAKTDSLEKINSRRNELEEAVRLQAQKIQTLQAQDLNFKQELQNAKNQIQSQTKSFYEEQAKKIKENLEAQANQEVKELKKYYDQIHRVEKDRMASLIQMESQKNKDEINQLESELKIMRESSARYKARLEDTLNEIENQKKLLLKSDEVIRKKEQTINELQMAVDDHRKTIAEQNQTISILNLEVKKLETQKEDLLQEMNKKQLVERLKYEAEIASLYAKLDALEKTQILVEKIKKEEVPEEILTTNEGALTARPLHVETKGPPPFSASLTT